jgi:hypothetical protein
MQKKNEVTLKRLNSTDMDYEETDEEKSFNAILRKFKSSNGIYSNFIKYLL